MEEKSAYSFADWSHRFYYEYLHEFRGLFKGI